MKKVLLILITVLLIILTTSCSSENTDLKVVIIDVDQGDSSLIITPNNKSLLVDSGKEEFTRSVLKNLKKHRVKKLDYILATHHDSDHIGSMDQIIEKYKVDTLLLTEEVSDKSEYLELMHSCKKKNLRQQILKAGDIFNLDKDCKVYVLAPNRISSDANKNSIVFLLEYKKNNLLFTGDADQDIEREIVKSFNLPRCNFLKVGHHGSKTSTSKELMDAIQPKVSTISCGYKNSYGHPHDITIDTLRIYNSKIYRTDENGDMVFYFDEKGMYLKNRYQDY